LLLPRTLPRPVSPYAALPCLGQLFLNNLPSPARLLSSRLTCLLTARATLPNRPSNSDAIAYSLERQLASLPACLIARLLTRLPAPLPVTRPPSRALARTRTCPLSARSIVSLARPCAILQLSGAAWQTVQTRPYLKLLRTSLRRTQLYLSNLGVRLGRGGGLGRLGGRALCRLGGRVLGGRGAHTQEKPPVGPASLTREWEECVGSM